MFEKIVLRRSSEGPALTAGDLAEALLFYQNVHVILDQGTLNLLIKQIGMPLIISLLARPNISAVYCKNLIGLYTTTKDNISLHDIVLVNYAGDQEVGALGTTKKVLQHTLVKKHGYKKKYAKNLIDRFRSKVPFHDLGGDHFINGGITKAARDDLNDDSFIHDSVQIALSDLLGPEKAPRSFVFKAHQGASGFQIETDLDFAGINDTLKVARLGRGLLSPALLIANVLNARADTILAAYYGGEFYTSRLASSIIRVKHAELLRRIDIERQELREFGEIVIKSAPSIREVINSGQRSFKEFLKILDKSERFKEWVQDINPDEKLVGDYLASVSSRAWLSTLPGKTLRYLFSAAIGVVNPVAGYTFSVADSFLVDKIAAGWRPSHFVNATLRPFVLGGDL